MAKEIKISYEKLDDYTLRQVVVSSDQVNNDLTIKNLMAQKAHLENARSLVINNHNERIANLDLSINSINKLIEEAERLGISQEPEESK